MEFIAAAEPGASCFPDDGCNFPPLVSWSPSKSMHSSRTNVYHCVTVHHCDAYWLNIGLFHCVCGCQLTPCWCYTSWLSDAEPLSIWVYRYITICGSLPAILAPVHWQVLLWTTYLLTNLFDFMCKLPFPTGMPPFST